MKTNKTLRRAVIEIIDPAMKEHWKSEIKIPREIHGNTGKLRQILKAKQKEYDKAGDSDEIERLVSEIEMLKFVLFLVCRSRDLDNRSPSHSSNISS